MDSETDFDNLEISQGTEQNNSEDGSAVIGNSVQMEIQDANNHESSTSYQKHMEISAGPHYSLLKWICIILIRIFFKYKLTKSAILPMCGLISTLLQLIDHPLHKIFPTTLDGVLNVLSLGKIEGTVFIVCPNDSCNQLYTETSLPPSKTCTHVTFGKRCGHELGYFKNMAFLKKTWVPHKTFYFVPPSAWITKFLSDSTFKTLIGKPMAPRGLPDNVMMDIVDGNVWKEFSKTNPSFNDKDALSIGLLLNVDWFKPFDRSEYKVSALMMSVINLPRNERFKKRWTMVLGIIPGPTEPKGNVNTFLQPMVEDLLLLWNGIPITNSTLKIVKAALLGVSSDMPALRKVSQYLGHKADLGCSRCNFMAERDLTKKGASGKMSYYTCVAAPDRTNAQVRDQAKEYQSAGSLKIAKEIQEKNGVRYSELVRLPYFDMVKMLITDPMHTFLLGMVQNEVKLCLQNILDSKLAEVYKRMQSIRLPYDIGRLPTNIKGADGLSGLTAQQWKNFACVYARPCFSGLLPDKFFKSLSLLCEIVVHITKPIMSEEDIETLYRLIHEHHKRFAAAYGKWDISINYHMALHICDIISDYGPPHGYWCYAYERMNGYLSEIPNNGRNIESQIMVKLLQQLCFSSCELPNISAKTSTALKPILATDVEMDADNYAVYQYKLYTSPVLDRFEYQCSIDRGEIDHWPIEFLHPSKSRVKVDKEVYKNIEEFCKKVYNTDGNVYANPMIDKFGRCAVNGQTYSSDFNSTDRGSVVVLTL